MAEERHGDEADATRWRIGCLHCITMQLLEVDADVGAWSTREQKQA